MDFERFFVATTGSGPYPYQRDLAMSATLPALLHAPTGSGKTAAVLCAWLWRATQAATSVRATTPRRLVYCLPMRSLVEQTADVADTLVAKLREIAPETPVVRVFRLLGGEVDDAFDEHPDELAILVGTQDLLLSRALNRGYAMSRYLWPVHFGLLHSDALWVFDETQLMGPGLSTSAQLEAFRRDPRTPPARPSHSLWMSATLDDGRLRTVDLATADLPSLRAEVSGCEPLEKRWRATKRLQRAESPARDTKSLADEIARVHVRGHRTLVVVNRVARAQALVVALGKVLCDVPIAVLHSRFRRDDRERISREAFANNWPGVLVATQVVEAGVDVSARVLFTELAPWSSLVQRFGRCNRSGEHTDGADVRWIDLPSDDAAPYVATDLDAARVRLDGLADVGIARLAALDVERSRPVVPVIRRKDLLDLFDTTPDLTGLDVDVGRFIRDAEGRDVVVAWREFGEAGAPAERERPPTDVETCRVPVDALGAFLKKAGASGFVWRGLRSQWGEVRTNDARSLTPGSLVLLPASAGGYDRTVGWTGDPKHGPVETRPQESRVGADGDSDDPRSESRSYVSLARHAADVAEEMRTLRDRIGGDQPWEVLERAARWHDIGKAHFVFQDTMQRSRPEGTPGPGDGPWAKSPGPMQRHRRASVSPQAVGDAPAGQDAPDVDRKRCHFRHELASALAWLAHGGDDLGAYLVAAHHGKVRMSLRSRPGETVPGASASRSEVTYALGVADGDPLPACDLGDGERSEAVDLPLAHLMLGGDDGSASWTRRTAALVEEHGPFRLAYWEALVRIADWRGSARHDESAARKVPS